MPYVFIYSVFPSNKGKDVAKVYVEEIKNFRPAARGLSKEIISGAIKGTMDGIGSIIVHDIKEGKLEEFLDLQQKAMVPYHDIEGFKYNIEVRAKVTEALEWIGMKMPE